MGTGGVGLSGACRKLVKGALRPSIYGYANARAKGMKSRLIPRDVLQQLIDAPDIHAVVGILERTEYAADLNELSLRHSGVTLVEFALGRHFARVARKVLEFSPGVSAVAVETFLKKWDAHNLKTILLGKHLGHPEGETAELLVPAGVFNERDLKRIQAHSSVEDVVSFLGSKGYGADLTPLIPEYKRTGSLQPLLDAIDVHYFSKFARALPQGMKDREKIVRLEEWDVDNKDILTLLRGRASKANEADIRRYLLLCGTLRAHDVAQLLSAPSMEDAVRFVGTRYAIEGLSEAYARERSLAAVEVALERARAEYGLNTLRTCVLSTGALIGYLALKENEIANIRHIVHSKEQGIAADKVRESIIIVG